MMDTRRMPEMVEILKQLTEVTRGLTNLLRDYPDEVLRGGIKHAVRVRRYYTTAQAVGVSREDAERLLAEARQDLTEWEYWFDATADAQRRLMEQYVAHLPAPSKELRRVARDMLAARIDTAWGERYTPADVDRLARQIEREVMP